VLTDEAITTITQKAFAPQRCVAEIWDYGKKMRFKVFDQQDNAVIEKPEVVLDHVRYEKQLLELLDQVRDQVQQKGFSLDPLS